MTVQEPITKMRWTVSDVELLPDNGTRYEIIDGDLFMAKSPHFHHQQTASAIGAELRAWSLDNAHGYVSINPGVIFTETDAVIPDVVWISHERLQQVMDEAGHLRGAPELVVEVLSPGAMNEQRDRETKLKLYNDWGVLEYWIADWRARRLTVYRRSRGQLTLSGTLLAEDAVTSPLLPNFNCPVARLFM